jgi:hypothetical protein
MIKEELKMFEMYKKIENLVELWNKMAKEKQFNRKVDINLELRKKVEELKSQGMRFVDNYQSWNYKNYEVIEALDIYVNDTKLATRLCYLLKNHEMRYTLV